MRMLLETGLSNAVMATALALMAAILSRLCRRPALSHALWLLVLLKLVTPPFFQVALPWSTLAAERERGESIADDPANGALLPLAAESESGRTAMAVDPGRHAEPAVRG